MKKKPSLWKEFLKSAKLYFWILLINIGMILLLKLIDNEQNTFSAFLYLACIALSFATGTYLFIRHNLMEIKIREKSMFRTVLKNTLLIVPLVIITSLFSFVIDLTLIYAVCIIGTIISLILPLFYLKKRKTMGKIVAITLLTILFGIPILLFFAISESMDPETCSKEFMENHRVMTLRGDVSHCDSSNWLALNYTGWKGGALCDIKGSEESFTPTDCYIEVANFTQNISKCDGIERVMYGNTYEPFLCLEQINNLSHNLAWCENTVLKEDCIAFVAKETNNLWLCKTIYNGMDRDCITPIAIQSNNISICQEFVNHEEYSPYLYAGFCINEFARETLSTWEICFNIENKELRNVCFQELIPETEDRELCEKHIEGCIEIAECKYEAENGETPDYDTKEEIESNCYE